MRNNMIYRAGAGDVGITANYARGFQIDHNTVILNGTFPWTIEYRFAASTGLVRNNLADGPLLARDGAQATLAGNLTGAQPAWFVNAPAGDLHLSAAATEAISQAIPLAAVTDDFDGGPRPAGPAADIGADEVGQFWRLLLPAISR